MLTSVRFRVWLSTQYPRLFRGRNKATAPADVSLLTFFCRTAVRFRVWLSSLSSLLTADTKTCPAALLQARYAIPVVYRQGQKLQHQTGFWSFIRPNKKSPAAHKNSQTTGKNTIHLVMHCLDNIFACLFAASRQTSCAPLNGGTPQSRRFRGGSWRAIKKTITLP